MKVSELKCGQRIMLPCPSCGIKRSVKFKCLKEWPKQKSQKCLECTHEDKDMAAWYSKSGSHQREKLRHVEGLE